METGALVLNPLALRSRVIRDIVGDRTVDVYAAIRKKNGGQNGDGGIIPFILNSGAKLVGFLVKTALGATGFLVASFFRFLADVALRLYYFDWAQTDASLKAQQDANNLAVVAALGQSVGTGAVWLGAIAIAGAATIKFPVVAGTVLLRLAEEGGDETRSAFIGVLMSIQNAVIENAMISGLLTARQMRAFGAAPVTKSAEPWTVSGFLDKAIEAIPTPTVKAFLTGLKNGLEDAFFEMLYVVAAGIEEGFEAARIANKTIIGKERMIEVTPNVLIPEEKVLLRGNEVALKTQVMGTLSTSNLMQNREIGQFVGTPLADYIRANPFVRKASVIFKSKAEPPYRVYGGEEEIKQASYSIPDLKPNTTWSQIKLACRHFTWGKFRATANLSNARQMAVYGATPSDAEDKLRELMQLSTAEILTLSITEEKDRDLKLRKAATEMYPAWFVVTVRKNDLTNPDITTIDGKGYSQNTIRYPIWQDEQPIDFENIV